MRHQKKSRRLSLKTAHRKSLIRNLALSVIEHGRIKTTSARAKVLRPFLEKLVTKAKDPTVANLRLIRTKLPNKKAIQSLKNDIAPVFVKRPGGYLRILKLAQPRVGDKADMSLVEWVEESLVGAYSQKEESTDPKAKKSTKKTAKKTTKSSASKTPSVAGGNKSKKNVVKKTSAKGSTAKTSVTRKV